MSVQFSVAGVADLDTLTGMVGEFTGEEGYPYDRSAVRAMLGDMLARDDIGRAWFIWDDGQLAGYVAVCFGWSIEFRGRDAFVDELFVRQAFRGRGHGTAAMQLVERQAPTLGIRALHLEVERHNIGARRLYERLGYRDRERHLMTLRFDTDVDETAAVGDREEPATTPEQARSLPAGGAHETHDRQVPDLGDRR